MSENDRPRGRPEGREAGLDARDRAIIALADAIGSGLSRVEVARLTERWLLSYRRRLDWSKPPTPSHGSPDALAALAIAASDKKLPGQHQIRRIISISHLNAQQPVLPSDCANDNLRATRGESENANQAQI